MKLDKEIIGKKIRQMRIEKGFSQEEFSEKIDISPRHMCTIENGNSFPSIETFVKIASVLDIDINKFFNLNLAKNDNLRSEIYDLLQISSVSELKLIKDIILTIRRNLNKI
jgi:transcriptional regulator with XRE-family HTH domain